MPKKTEKRVKAWAVHDNRGGFICAYANREMANLDVKEGEKYGLYYRNIIPCTITYSLPSQGKGKKKPIKLAKK